MVTSRWQRYLQWRRNNARKLETILEWRSRPQRAARDQVILPSRPRSWLGSAAMWVAAVGLGWLAWLVFTGQVHFRMPAAAPDMLAEWVAVGPLELRGSADKLPVLLIATGAFLSWVTGVVVVVLKPGRIGNSYLAVVLSSLCLLLTTPFFLVFGAVAYLAFWAKVGQKLEDRRVNMGALTCLLVLGVLIGIPGLYYQLHA